MPWVAGRYETSSAHDLATPLQNSKYHTSIIYSNQWHEQPTDNPQETCLSVEII